MRQRHRLIRLVRASCLAAVALVIACHRSTQTAPSAGVYPLDEAPARWSDDDLAPLRAVVGDARVVGLGEIDHGSGGLLRAKFRVVRFLVEALGFRAVGLETDWHEAEAAAAYVRTCEGSPEAALRSLRDFYQDDGVRDGLAWLCAFNRAHPGDGVTFFGFDIQEPYAQRAALRAFFDKVAPDRAAGALARIDRCFGVGAASWSAFRASPEWKAYATTKALPDDDERACSAGVRALEEDIAANEAPFREASSDTELALARLALSDLGAWERQAYNKYRSTLGNEARDDAMLATVRELQRLYFPNKKVALSIHDVHVGAHMDDAVGAVLEANRFRGATLMGVRLARELGPGYVPISFTGYDVASHWPVVPRVPIPTAADSIEAMLHALGRPALLLDTRGPWLARGAVYQMSQHDASVRLDPGANFRAILYLDRAAATPLPRAERRDCARSCAARRRA